MMVKKRRRKQIAKVRKPKNSANDPMVQKYFETRDYRIYLQTTHWKKFRNEVIKQRGNRCERCGCQEKLQVHHLRYELFKEKYRDVFVLCDDCHQQEHSDRYMQRALKR